MSAGGKRDQFPRANLGLEQVIWKNDVMTGIINRKIVETQIITNYRVIQNQTSISLADLDDIIVMNSHRESQSQRTGYYVRGFITSHGTGRGKTIGDVVFMHRGQPIVIFRQIADPTGVCRLAKTARKSFAAALKQAEKAEARLKKENDMRMQNAVRVQAKHNRPSRHASTISTSPTDSIPATCSKCGHSNPAKSNFCVRCGSRLSPCCSKCGNDNPTGSAFCNKCGFALA